MHGDGPKNVGHLSKLPTPKLLKNILSSFFFFSSLSLELFSHGLHIISLTHVRTMYVGLWNSPFSLTPPRNQKVTYGACLVGGKLQNIRTKTQNIFSGNFIEFINLTNLIIHFLACLLPVESQENQTIPNRASIVENSV